MARRAQGNLRRCEGEFSKAVPEHCPSQLTPVRLPAGARVSNPSPPSETPGLWAVRPAVSGALCCTTRISQIHFPLCLLAHPAPSVLKALMLLPPNFHLGMQKTRLSWEVGGPGFEPGALLRL